MSEKRLTNDLIADPSLYRLGLQLSDHALDVVITSRVSDASPECRRIELDVNSDEPSKPFEDAVYDNPLLTADFGRTDIVIDSRRFFLVPAERTDDEAGLAEDIATLYGDDTKLVPIVNLLDQNRVALVTMADAGIVRFIGRTFPGATITHRLAAVARYHTLRNHLGNTGKIHVRLHDGATDVIAIGHQGLLMANSFQTPTVNDAVYYTMAASSTLGFDNDNDRILVSGRRDLRDSFIGELRRFVTFAMPEIFPAQLASAGADSAGRVPFALACIQLCD